MPDVASAQRRQSSGARAVTSTSLEAGAASIRYDEFLRSGAFTLSPALRVRGQRSALLLRGSASVFQSGSVSAQGEIAGSAYTAVSRGFSGELSGSLSLNGYRSSNFMGVAAVGAYVHYARTRLGAQAGGLAGYAPSSFTENVSSDPGFLRGLASAWVAPPVPGAPRLELEITPTTSGVYRYADWEGTARWTRPRWELAGSAGARTGNAVVEGAVRRWVDASAAYRLTRRLAVVAGGGSYPPDLAQGIPGARYAVLSMRITSRPRLSGGPRRNSLATDSLLDAASADFLVRRAPGAADPAGDAHTIRVRAPSDVSRVELMGDFTAWEPVTLVRTPDGYWEITLPLAPGTHRLNVRFDSGDWTVPAGLVTQEDDFGGVVGVFTVR